MPIAKVVVLVVWVGEGGRGSVNSNAGEDESGRSPISSQPPLEKPRERVSVTPWRQLSAAISRCDETQSHVHACLPACVPRILL